MLTYQNWRRFNRWLISLQTRRIPQGFVLLSGLGSIGFGAIFITLPDRIDQSPTTRALTNALPPDLWGMVFFGIGVLLAALAVAKYEWSWPVSLALVVVMFAFVAFTAVDVFMGQSSGLLALSACIVALMNALSGSMSVPQFVERVANGGKNHQ